jgi:hypothetical protein
VWHGAINLSSNQSFPLFIRIQTNLNW